MSTEANKAAVRRYIEEVINGGNHALIDELFTPELGVRVKDFLADGDEAFPDGREEIQDLVAEGDTVMARWIFSGTHQGSSFFDIPATGKRIEIHGCAVYRFENGRIAWDTMTMDWLDALEQIGAAISPPASGGSAENAPDGEG